MGDISSVLTAASTFLKMQNYAPAPGNGNNGRFLHVPRGQMTFDAEGIESVGSQFHSRVAHQPTLSSGITIGRGYDMKFRSQGTVIRDLVAAGVDSGRAAVLALGAGLNGERAKGWLRANRPLLPEITLQEQEKLFSEVTYPWYVSETKRLVESWLPKNNADVWDGLGGAKQDFLIDLRYRGDLTAKNFNVLRPALNANGTSELAQVVATASIFRSVPRGRQAARLDFLKAAESAGLN